jgi:enoyl-CoA hydratase
VLTITIEQPGKRNAVDPATALELRAAFEHYEQSDEYRVAVLTGAGEHFCAGADLKAIDGDELTTRLLEDGTDPGPLGPTRMAFSKPVIAAVEGYAVAGGLELALMCDFRVASESAVFGVFCRRWGVPLIDGGTVRLPRVVGQGWAMDMILTGRPVAADEALRIGLANRLVAPGEALATAQQLAQQIAKFPQGCMNADRASAYQQWDLPTNDALINEACGGYPIVFAEAVNGAQRFAGGLGRHGSFEKI